MNHITNHSYYYYNSIVCNICFETRVHLEKIQNKLLFLLPCFYFDMDTSHGCESVKSLRHRHRKV